MNTIDLQSLLSNGNEPLKQTHKPTLVGSIGSGQKMGMEKIELASVIFKKNHVIQLQLKKDDVILKVDRQGFPMIPKTCHKINFTME